MRVSKWIWICTLLLCSNRVPAQSEDLRKQVLDNFDIAPRAAAIEARSLEKSKYAVKPSVKKVAIQPKGEGYYRNVEPSHEPTKPVEPKIYSELYATIDDSGRVMLTSDTIIVKPTPSATTSTLTASDTTGSPELDGFIQKAAKRYNVDPRLILEVMRQESGFRNNALSYKGAQGLMQLMPATAARFGVYRTYDPEENILGGTRYLRFLLDKFNGNVELALAGYNAGENAVIRYGFNIPPYRETRDYVRSISARYRSKYHQITDTKPEEPVARTAPLMTFAAEDGRVVLSNNY